MPAFEGLFHRSLDAIVQTTLFWLGAFYSFARMTMHTETTLQLFDQAVSSLGKALRAFQHGCADIVTKELPKETQSRIRRRAGKTSRSAKPKRFNLNTYKVHRLGDYPNAVREFGPLDNFSTQTVRTLR